jgi:hypothetical protein
MSQIIRCDSCGRPIDAKKGMRFQVTVRCGIGFNADMQECSKYNYKDRDFCEDCIKLNDIFYTMDTEDKKKLIKGVNVLETGDTNPIEKPKRKREKEAAAEEQTEAEGQQESNRKVDEGKVMALYRTGGKWDYNYIADEMGIDPEIVRMVVMKHLRKPKIEE